METNSLTPTIKGQLKHAKNKARKTIPIRLLIQDHKELKDQAEHEARSMSFIAMRRYLKGRELELKEENQ